MHKGLFDRNQPLPRGLVEEKRGREGDAITWVYGPKP